MIITIKEPVRSDTEWEVWVHIAEGDPLEQTESFVIGTGKTRNEALDDATELLQVSIGRLHRLRA